MGKLHAYLGFGILLLSVMAGTAVAATITPNITYQGLLTDSTGNPLTGTYSMTFRLYDVVSGGTATAVDAQSVTVDKGVFTTPVALSSSFFDGRALWLGLSVGSDPELAPRQELRPVPYALGLRPGAQIIGDLSNYLLTIKNTGSGRVKNGLYVETVGQNSPAVYAYTTGTGSNAIYGGTTNEGPAAVAGVASGRFSPGVYGRTTNTSAHALYGTASGSGSYGVYGESANDVGVYGKGKVGGFFTTNQAGPDMLTRPIALNVSANYKNNVGIWTNTTQDNSAGLEAETWGDRSFGAEIYTMGPNSDGVNIVTWNAASNGVDVRAHGLISEGVHAESGQSYGVYASTGNSNSYGIYTPNRLYAGGGVFPTSDVAEYMPVTENVTPGTVLVIGDDGKLQVTSTAYDTRVAGIVSTKPGISLGAKENGNDGEQIIAIAGRVPCNVDASNGPIHPGDLLTTSNTPGYAMKATDPKMGTILGKAMGTWEIGSGTIDVLVTLQ